MGVQPFCNDPQPPFFFGGQWHLYYLWNKDYPTGNGSEWRHAVSSDLQDWQDVGVAIPKYTTAYGDPWSGVAIVDTHNTAGFGSNAVISLCTMPCPSGPGQSTARWVSQDGGYTFTFDRIVMWNPAPGVANNAFRDPRVVWMEQQRCWILVMAESNKIGFYRSTDLAHWSYVSGFTHAALGVLECPCLFPITPRTPDGRPGATKWVLLCGANGFQNGFTTGTHYWVGQFDGTSFIPDEPTGQWLDNGSDFYAAAIWGNKPITSSPQAFYYAIAWKNNWDYANLLTQSGYFGGYSTTRALTLVGSGGTFKLTNDLTWYGTPAKFERTGPRNTFPRALAPFIPVLLPPVISGSYAFFAKFSVRRGASWPSKISIALQSGLGTPIGLILSPQAGYVTLQRSLSGVIPSQDQIWLADRNAPIAFGTTITIMALIDTSSIEIVFNDGALSLTSLVFPTLIPGLAGINVEGGTCTISNYGIVPL